MHICIYIYIYILRMIERVSRADRDIVKNKKWLQQSSLKSCQTVISH